MLSRLCLLVVYPHAVGAAECLVGCLVQGISPFDDDNLVVWDDRSACNSTIVGCEVSAIRYPNTYYQGALWASTSGIDGASDCTCSICDPYPWSVTTSYMSDQTSLWSRIHCYLAASEASGYDVSPCVAAIVDTETLLCVDDVYESPTMDQFECKENRIEDISDSSSVEQCNWDGDVRMAQELFPATSASSPTTASSVAVNTNSCLVGCLVQGISPFDDDNIAVWDNRAACDSTTIGCAVSAIRYPNTYYQGALWASSWGTDGSTSCTCSICDPYPWSVTTSYMSEETSLWARIHCYLVASEASGYDVSPCVAAILDTETLPCVDDVYESPTVDQFECEENGIIDLTSSESWEVCSWAGEQRLTTELYGGTRAPSPVSGSTTAPAPLNTRDVTPQPGITSTDSPEPAPTTLPVTSPPSTNGPQPVISSTASPVLTPTAPSVISPPSTNGPQPSITITDSPDLTPAAPPRTSPPSVGGSTPPLETQEGVPCEVGSTCQDDFCCHPDTNTCGRKYTYCQQRDFSDGPRCCSGVDGDPSESNVCSEDSICDEPARRTTTEEVDFWAGLVSSIVCLAGIVWGALKWYKKKTKATEGQTAAPVGGVPPFPLPR